MPVAAPAHRLKARIKLGGVHRLDHHIIGPGPEQADRRFRGALIEKRHHSAFEIVLSHIAELRNGILDTADDHRTFRAVGIIAFKKFREIPRLDRFAAGFQSRQTGDQSIRYRFTGFYDQNAHGRPSFFVQMLTHMRSMHNVPVHNRNDPSQPTG
jgi:hypothetical protein